MASKSETAVVPSTDSQGLVTWATSTNLRAFLAAMFGSFAMKFFGQVSDLRAWYARTQYTATYKVTNRDGSQEEGEWLIRGKEIVSNRLADGSSSPMTVLDGHPIRQWVLLLGMATLLAGLLVAQTRLDNIEKQHMRRLAELEKRERERSKDL